MNAKNKIAIQVETTDEVKAIDKLCGTSYKYFYDFVYENQCLYLATQTHSSEQYCLNNKYKIIKAKDFLNNLNSW